MQFNILNDDELYELTRYKRKKEQKQWLKENGIFFLPAADGSPRVSTELVNSILGVDISATSKKKPKLDFDAIKSYGGSNGTKNTKK
jgi:Domain of unknown function (DUF4224)